MRKHLAEYATQVFTLAGQTPQQAATSAQTVLMVETLLAADSMDRTKMRDPKNRDHKMTREEAVALAPDFYLNRYFAAVGAPDFTSLNVTNPDFFKQVNGVVAALPLDSLKTYVSWHVLRAAAPWLSQPFVEANFKMRQALTGTETDSEIAGSAASIWWIDLWARLWGSAMSRRLSEPRASSAC